MAVRAGLKAGLISGAVVLVLSLLALIPIPFLDCVLDCVCCGVTGLVFVGAGVLSGFFLTPPRNAGSGAGAGAIGGLIAGLVYAIVEIIILVIQMLAGSTSGFLTPEMIEQLRQAGVDPQTFEFLAGTGGAFIGSALCCIGSLGFGAGLGAAGGAILGAAKCE